MTTPAGDRCFIRDAHPFVKIHFNPKTEGWRQVRNRRRTPSRTKHSSTCSESRTAFNLIWVYLHKSLLDSNVLGIDACVEKLYTARQRDFLRNFHPPWDWVGSKRGSVRSVRRESIGQKEIATKFSAAGWETEWGLWFRPPCISAVSLGL